MSEITNKKRKRPQVVIVGGGFGGLEVAKRLSKVDVDITLIDRNNYHLFQPLLYQVATGGLSPANIATPLRAIVGRQKNCEVLLAKVKDFEAKRRHVILEHGHVAYDYLVVAAGSSHTYFGNEQWQAHAPGLKSLAEATDIRRRIFMAFEAAEREKDPVVRRELMTFVIVGGGPTGVELAGALSEIASNTLKNDFRHIQPDEARIILVEAGNNVLGSYSDSLVQYAENKLGKLHIETRIGQKVISITDRCVTLQNSEGSESDVSGSHDKSVIGCRTVFWAAGVKGSSLGSRISERFDISLEKDGTVPVNENLELSDGCGVFVVGDLAHRIGANEKPLPKVAPVAIQQGRYVAKRIRALTRRADQVTTSSVKPFRYRDLGSMATIGRAAAIAEIGKLKLRGFSAWLLWLAVHLMQLVQFQNRLLVLIQWGWNYITFNRSARIIVGTTSDDEELHPTPSPERIDKSTAPVSSFPASSATMEYSKAESHA